MSFGWIKSTSLAVVLVAVLGMVACPSQQTTASIWHQAGVLADTFITLYAPAWSATNKTNFDKAWALAETEIAGWKAGTPCANVVQAINNAAAILATVPILNDQQRLLMAAIVASVNVVTTNFAACQPKTLGPEREIKWQAGVQATANTLPPPKNASDVKKLWKDAGGQ